MNDAKREPQVERIPSNLVTIHGIHVKRVERKTRRIAKLAKDVEDKIKGRNNEIIDAMDDLRDLLDQEYLDTGKDPESGDVSRDQRDPDRLIKHHKMDRYIKQMARVNNEESRKLDKELSDHEDFKSHQEANSRMEAWMDEFCLHFGVASGDIDWEKCEMKVYPKNEEDEVPESLMEVPVAA